MTFYWISFRQWKTTFSKSFDWKRLYWYGGWTPFVKLTRRDPLDGKIKGRATRVKR